ncbi:type VI secretion system Vgr family protein [Paraburkholderia sp. MM5482-R1]|uniref:type VI secretion system Vgr family protein n=1 Tax=unclassified Paraburkholderia TaxID=2615204 RepID=UPI003D24C606
MLTLVPPRTFTVSGAALPTLLNGEPALQLRTISGEEALSKIYQYELELVTTLDPLLSDHTAANFDLKAMVGKEMTVTVQLDGMGAFVPGMPGMTGAANIGAGVREISGIVTAASLVRQLERQFLYRLVLRPWIVLAERRTDYRIFQNITVVEIIDAVLRGNYPYTCEKRLGNVYPNLVYQVQYGESDFSFIQRLMEENGIYWFFEHSNGIHRMVLVDNQGAHRPVESAAYRTLWYYPPDYKIDREYISAFDTTESIQSGIWTTNDFDFTRPKADLAVQNALPQDTAHNRLTVYEWPGDYTDPAQGEQFARVRMEEIRAKGERAEGRGNLRDVVCGTTFTLAGYPQDAANREYLVIRARLDVEEIAEATGAAQYRVSTTFDVQPTTTIFRPERTVDKPRTTGPQTAIVTGPREQEIWTDQYGRVKLKFHWDHSDVNDQNSSCWVRVSYPWTGSNFGGVNIPRIGSEVIVDFENGDPDRPIVTGRVFNAMTMPPWELPGSATQSGIISRSMKGGQSNFSGIRFEDKEGSEEFMLQAEKDMNSTIKHDESHTVGNDRVKTVVRDETGKVGRDRTVAITRNESIGVGSGFAMLVGALPAADAPAPAAGTYTLKVTESLVLECGASKITLLKNGHIALEGVQIVETAKGAFQMTGKRIDLNNS